MKQITLVLRYFTIGGLERVVSALANGYVARNYDVKIIVLSKGKRNSLITELNPRIKVVFLTGNLMSKLKELRRQTTEGIVHIHFGDGRIHPMIRWALSGRTVVVTCHSVYSHKRNAFLNLVDKHFTRKVKKVVGVSDAVKRFCVEEVGMPEKKVCVIKNGIEVKNNVRKREATKELRILSLASLYPHKNHEYLIRAIADLKGQTDIPFKVGVIGDGPCMADLYLKSVELGLRDNIIWYGAVWQADIVQGIIEQSDVFVSASKYEGFPISILEGMSKGLPMILSDIAPHREVAGEKAMYFKLDDNCQSFVSCLKKFYEDKELRKEMSEYSMENVKKFSIEGTVDKYLKVYEEALSK